MKTKILAFACAVVSMAATSLQALPVTGTVDMSGTAILDNTLLGSANGVTSFGVVTVGGIPDGTFTGTAGAAVTWNPFNWNPANTPIIPLWTYTVGLTTYSFDLTTVSVDDQDNQFLNLLGTGVLHATGYTDTAGTWSFTISNPTGGAHANFAFTFANSQTASVPDGGMTVAMLGLALSGLGLVRRKFLA